MSASDLIGIISLGIGAVGVLATIWVYLLQSKERKQRYGLSLNALRKKYCIKKRTEKFMSVVLLAGLLTGMFFLSVFFVNGHYYNGTYQDALFFLAFCAFLVPFVFGLVFSLFDKETSSRFLFYLQMVIGLSVTVIGQILIWHTEYVKVGEVMLAVGPYFVILTFIAKCIEVLFHKGAAK